VNLLRGDSVVVYAILIIIHFIFFPGPGRAQGFVSGEFKLSQEVRWENSVLPMGEYEYSVDSRKSPSVVHVQQKNGGFSAVFTPRSFLRDERQGSSGLGLASAGNETYVTSISLQKLGGQFIFSAPGNAPEKARGDAVEANGAEIAPRQTLKYLSVVNPHREKVPDDEAENVYLKACEAVEKEFGRRVPIRPRVILRVGAGENILPFKTREILLKKWDEVRFADAVVDLALYDMVPAEERLKLSNSAIHRAGATASVCELKSCKN
jgi:hypothetical protein